jgi:S-(hydroxymethyl)glutathione dehydrogenase / alcohol dehydrogenase
MNAAVLRESRRPLSIESLRLDAPRTGEVLVRIKATGVCHSDLMAADGTMPVPLPAVLGHEAAGIVEEVGPGVRRVRPDDHVILSWAPECGECFYCMSGHSNLCERYAPRVLDGTLLDGTTRLRAADGEEIRHYSFLSSFAEASVVPETCCVPIDRSMPFAQASLVGCAVMTGIGAAINTAKVRAGGSVAVLGCGGVGISAVQGARICGASRIVAVDVRPDKEALARLFGATDFVLASDTAVEEIRALTHGRGADYVFEATGRPAVMRQAYAATRRGGTLVYIGIAPAGADLVLPATPLPRDEKTIAGSFYGGAMPRRDFLLILDMYARGQVKLDEMISDTLPLSGINDALDSVRRGSGLRSVIDLTREDAHGPS